MKATKLVSMMLVVAMVGSFSSCKKKGCTNQCADNYNPDAVKDDGSCNPVLGCMDRTSLNYVPCAETDDGSCEYTSVSITSVKKALVLKTTATWCPYCGDWGTTYSNNIMTNNANATVIQLHKNDEFSTAPGDEIRNVLTTGSVPHFFVGTEDMANNYTVINNRVGEELAESVEISMGFDVSTSGSSMSVKVAAQKDESTSGEYYLAVYVLEDGMVAPQKIGTSASNTTDNSFVHDHVLRAEASNAGFGKAITFTGDVIEENFTISLNSSWVTANCYPVAVVWRKNGSTYDFVNLTM